MNFKEKFFTQAVICCMFFTAVKATDFINIDTIKNARTAVETRLERNYTADEVKQAGSQLLEKAKDAPAVITSTVLKANQLGEFGQPIDEDTSLKTRCVYAVNEGSVVASGISGELGSFVKIQHDERVSTYGNLTSIKVIQGDKVRKGDIIGTYDKNSEKKFYYDLEENLQT